MTEIVAAPNGGPYVLISLADPRDLRESTATHFGAQMKMFTSMEDLVKDLQRAFTGLPRMMMDKFTTVIKLDIREYEESEFKVGDRVYLEIKKVEREGV